MKHLFFGKDDGIMENGVNEGRRLLFSIPITPQFSCISTMLGKGGWLANREIKGAQVAPGVMTRNNLM